MLAAILVDKKLDLRIREKERILDWHRDMQNLFSDVISVGRRMRIGREPDIELIDELFPEVAELESKSNTMPTWVRIRVDPEVKRRVVVAAGMAYHLAHLPAPDREADSIAGVIYHFYEMLRHLDADTDVQVREVIDVIGDLDGPSGWDVSEEEAERILEEFESESMRRLDDWEKMTVDELMQLPWQKVDEVLRVEQRRKLVKYCVEVYYEKALIEKPREAKSTLEKSEEAFVG